ncbi:MAG: RagB/SusD family nutrient uptake outer membrane protein, partial [Bacteroides caccae]|nr:RagB/SusD family nutrient uptake outer membrane protein [Bacteroides caccae]
HKVTKFYGNKKASAWESWGFCCFLKREVLQHLLAPIPQDEINKRYGMTQNPGW